MKFKLLRILTLMIMIVSLFPFPASFASTDASQTGIAGVYPVKVVSSGSFTVALDASGSVWTWGKNNYGQLGTGDIADHQYPVQVAIGGSPKMKDIVAGPTYTLALDIQGNVWQWGMLPPNPNNVGINTPTLVNGLSNIQQIAAGEKMAMALTSDGTVLTWGSNYFAGELGQGSQFSSPLSMNLSPSPVVIDENNTVLTGIKQIAKGYLASYALKDDGTVYQWGVTNLQNNTSSSVATAVSGISGATAIVSNPKAGFAYAVTSSGIFAWGQNMRGQLGTGDTKDSYTPVQVTSLKDKSLKSLSVGMIHVLALMNDGSVWGIGANFSGQLGDPQIYGQATQFTQITTVSNVKAVFAGYDNSFFINEDGTVVASGLNYDFNTRVYGLLDVGYNFASTNRPMPMIPFASSYDIAPRSLKNVSIQVVNNDQLKFTYDIPALSNLDKIYFDVFPMGGSTASLSGSTRRYDSPFGGVTGVTHTLDGHLPPGTYSVKIHTEFTGNRSVSETLTYDNNGKGYTVNPGSVTLRVPVKEWNVSTAANQSVSNSVYGSVYSAPVSGVTVTIVDDNDFRHTMTANTSTDGVAVFNHLYPGLYHVGITNGMNGEVDETIVQDPVFVFGSQVSHTLQMISNTQPTNFVYRQAHSTLAGKISGYVSWHPSSTPQQVTNYHFYFEGGNGNKLGDMILDTPFVPDWTNYDPDIPETNIPTGAIGIRLYTFDGTSEHITPDFVSLWNDSMLPVHASMQSTDSTKNNLSGTIKWDAASNEMGISNYVIMPDFQLIDGNNERNEIRIAEIPANGVSTYSFNLSDFPLLDTYNSPSNANQYMIGVENVMGQLLGYLNSNQQFVPYTSVVAITPYSPDTGGNTGSNTGNNTGGSTQPSQLQQNSDGSLTVTPITVIDSNGRKVSQVNVDTNTILDALDHLPSSSDKDQLVLQIPSDGWDDFEFDFEAELFQKLLNKNPKIVLTIQSMFAAFHFPASTVQKSLEQFGVPLTGANVKLRMSKKSLVNDELLHQLGVSSVTTPIDYKMNLIEKSGSNHTMNQFDSYSKHLLNVHSSFSETSFSHLVGVMIDPATGKYYPVPAIFTKDSKGNLQAQIYGRNNAVYAVVQNSKTFRDVENSYAKDAIDTLASKFVLNGYEDGSFKPTKTVTRAEFITMLTRALGVTPDTSDSQPIFKDVKSGDWFAQSVGSAVKAHLIDGYSDGTFKPNVEISRMEMLQMIYKAMYSSGMWKETASPAEIDKILSRYADHDSIQGWAKEAMAVAIKTSITSGVADDKLAPAMNADRAQSASFLYRMLKNLNLIN